MTYLPETGTRNDTRFW